MLLCISEMAVKRPAVHSTNMDCSATDGPDLLGLLWGSDQAGEAGVSDSQLPVLLEVEHPADLPGGAVVVRQGGSRH